MLQDTTKRQVDAPQGLEGRVGTLSSAGNGIRFFLERAPLMMGTVALLPDGDLLHLYDNPATARFFGIEPGQSQGRTARQLGVAESQIALWRSHYEQALASGEHVAFEYTHDLDSGPRVLSVIVSALSAADGGPARCSYIAEDVTERRRAETALSESEASLRALFEQAAVGLALVGLDGRWLRVNRRICEMLGYSEAELSRLTFQELTHPDDLAPDLANVERLLAGEITAYNSEKRYYRRDGSLLWARLTVSLLRDEAGRPDRFVSVLEDITSRRAAEEALRLTQRRLTMAARAAGLGVWEWMQGSELVHYSERAREIYGFGPDEPVTFERILAAVHPEDRAHVRARAERRRLAEDEQAVIDYRILHPELGVRWVRAVSTALVESGKGGQGPVRLFGTLEDVTAHRQVLDRLAASEARLQLALDAGRMAVFEWPLHDPQPPLTPELRAQLGIGEDEASTVEERRARYHPDDAALASSTRQRALEGEDRFLDFVFRYFWPDGQMRWLQVRSEIMRAESGEPHSLVGVQMDITEQRENEERLGLLMREVDHRANNLLAVVQSLVALTRAGDVESFRAVLAGRIEAMSRAHRLLAEARWTGAELRRLVEEELRPYGLGERRQIHVSGPEVSLQPAQAQAIGLALHELATNAAKHGALSTPDGQVWIAWDKERGSLVLDWRESDGPPVKAPARKGFGATVLQRSLGGALGGEAELDWAAEGVRARLRLPLEPPVPHGAPQGSAQPQG